MCTSASTACWATSSGVENSGPTSTSKPMSAKAVTTTFWPRSWPSWPILATRMRGRRPSSSSNLSAASRTCCTSWSPAEPDSSLNTPLIVRITAWCRPYTFSSASEISPTVALARAASTARVSRFWSSEPPWHVAVAGRLGQRVERPAYVVVVALGAEPLELGDLLAVDLVVVDLEHVERVLVGEPVGVDADHLLVAGVDPGLGAGRRLLDAHLRDALLDRLGHAAGLLGLEDVRPGALGEVVGEPLDVVGAAPRVDGAGGAALLLEQQLGVAGDPGREVGRQRDRLVEGVGVQRLGVALGRGHRLDAGALRRC